MTILHRRIILSVLLSTLACGGLFALVVALTPPTVQDHYEGIGWVLQRRGVRYADLDAKLPWPDGLNYYMYGPHVYPYQLNVKIFMPDGRIITGYLYCTDGMKQCTLDVPELTINKEPTPDVRDGAEWPWLRWLKRLGQ